MPYARCVGLTPTKTSSLLKQQGHIQEKQKAMNQWNNAAYEEKEKYHHFTHPARDYTNSHPPFQQKWKNEDVRNRATPGARKIKQI